MALPLTMLMTEMSDDYYVLELDWRQWTVKRVIGTTRSAELNRHTGEARQQLDAAFPFQFRKRTPPRTHHSSTQAPIHRLIHPPTYPPINPLIPDSSLTQPLTHISTVNLPLMHHPSPLYLHSSTYSSTHTYTHPLIPNLSFTDPPTRIPTHSFFNSSTTHLPLIHHSSLTHPPTHSPTHSLIPTHPSLIQPNTYPPTHSSTHSRLIPSHLPPPPPPPHSSHPMPAVNRFFMELTDACVWRVTSLRHVFMLTCVPV